jgi:hypothetical protein
MSVAGKPEPSTTCSRFLMIEKSAAVGLEGAKASRINKQAA